MNTDARALSQHAKTVHAANAKWWINLKTGVRVKRNIGELLMLVVSELAEAMEGHRKSKMDDKLTDRPMLEVEIADALIRVLDIMGGLHLSFHGCVSNLSWTDNVGENLLLLTTEVIHCFILRGYPDQFARLLERVCVDLISFAEYHKLDLDGAFHAKMAYNATRVDHTVAHRLAEGGKKY